MDKKNKTVNELIHAFADCNQQGIEHGAKRNLNYKAEHGLDATTLLAAFELALGEEGEYNRFNVNAVKAVIKHFGPTATYYPGRESSPCIYVQVAGFVQFPIDNRIREWINTSIGRCDEYSREHDGRLRLWWD